MLVGGINTATIPLIKILLYYTFPEYGIVIREINIIATKINSTAIFICTFIIVFNFIVRIVPINTPDHI